MQLKRKGYGIAVILIVLAAGTLGLWLWGRNRSARTLAAVQFETVVVRHGEVALRVEASGTVAPLDEVEVRPEIVGEIISIPVKAGDYVHKGQVLAVLDAADSRIALEKARADYLAAVAKVASLEDGASASELDQSRAALRQSEIAAAADQAELERGEALYSEKLITRQQLDSLKNQALSSQEQVRSAKAKLQQLQEPPSSTELTSARAQLSASKLSWETQSRQYGDLKGGSYYVTAPIDGLILQINGKVGASKATGSSGQEIALMTLIDPSRLEVQMNIDESDLSKIALGQKTSFSFQAFEGRPFSGRITSIAAEGTVSDGVTVFTVTASLDNPGSQVRPGMNADVTIWQERHPGVLVLPNNAIVSKMGLSMVRVPGDGQPKLKRIEIGVQDDTYTQILSGLNAGDQVLIEKKAPLGDTKDTSRSRSGFGNPMGGPMGGIH